MKPSTNFFTTLHHLAKGVDSALVPLLADELKGVPGDENRRSEILRRLENSFGHNRILKLYNLLGSEIQHQTMAPRRRLVKAVGYPLGAFALYTLYPVFGGHESALAVLASAQVAAGAMAVPYARKDKKAEAFIARLTWLQQEVTNIIQARRDRGLASSRYASSKYQMKNNIYMKDIYNHKKLNNYYKKELLNYGKGYW